VISFTALDIYLQ